MIRVVLADDHYLVRKGIRALLEKEGNIEVIGEADNGQDAINLVNQLKPDVLLTDIAMPGLNGIQVAQNIKNVCSTQVVILSMHLSPAIVRKAVKSGVKGYVLKQSLIEELILAVRAASQGKTFFSPEISDILLHDYVDQIDRNDSTEKSIDRLTDRELEVLQLIAEGNTNTSIAEIMNISIRTVERHRANLMDKLCIHDIAGLTRFAIANKLIFVES